MSTDPAPAPPTPTVDKWSTSLFNFGRSIWDVFLKFLLFAFGVKSAPATLSTRDVFLLISGTLVSSGVAYAILDNILATAQASQNSLKAAALTGLVYFLRDLIHRWQEDPTPKKAVEAAAK
ncbi:hypothetical protein [Singulisphaera sp. PoT]|uniref:hypothetical protein n=1 Tax=Singulisphaera sp. PoT TaxID=3411797 RepID=UPI003BF4D683